MFPPQAVRIPGKFPWARPAPLPFGTVLIEPKDGRSGVYSDGAGGWFFTTTDKRATRASSRRTR
jgi:hypothetical protein